MFSDGLKWPLWKGHSTPKGFQPTGGEQLSWIILLRLLFTRGETTAQRLGQERQLRFMAANDRSAIQISSGTQNCLFPRCKNSQLLFSEALPLSVANEIKRSHDLKEKGHLHSDFASFRHRTNIYWTSTICQIWWKCDREIDGKVLKGESAGEFWKLALPSVAGAL